MPLRRDRCRRFAAAMVLAASALLGACGDDEHSDRPVVEVFGNVVGAAGERLGAALRDASRDASVELRYVGVTSFSEQLTGRLDRGDRPGIVLLPQPGRLRDLDDRGLLQPLDAALATEVRGRYPEALVDLASLDGEVRGVWLTIDVKGLVWYRPAQFESLGLQVPATLDELATLAASLRADRNGPAPFCLAVEAGASTGWVGTDWVESYVLRRLGAEQYDQWVAGTLPFDSAEITAVFNELDSLVRAPGAVAGGTGAALGNPWELAAGELLAEDSPCLMVHQGDFLRREFPAGTAIGPDGDVDFFVLPGVDAAPAPMVLGGLLAAPLDDAPEVAAAMAALAGEEVAAALNATGLFLSPLDGGPADGGDAIADRLVDVVNAAPLLRFDASDLMVPAVGSGSFWSGMRGFFAGETIASVLGSIEEGRPAEESE